MSRPELAAIALADPPQRWAALGFAVEQDSIALGGVQVRLGLGGSGIAGWTLRGLDSALSELDGLPTTSEPEDPDPATSEPEDPEATLSGKWLPGHQNPLRVEGHPNGAVAIDHVVVLTPAFDRTTQALERAGLPLRRIIDQGQRRMGFRRLGPTIMEVVETTDAPTGPARFWGLTVTVSDLPALQDRLGSHLSEIRPAVQPGRHIATLQGSAGLSTPVAFITPE